MDRSDGFTDSNRWQSDSSKILLAAIRIQIFVRSKLMLWRARQERAMNERRFDEQEKAAFALLAAHDVRVVRGRRNVAADRYPAGSSSSASESAAAQESPGEKNFQQHASTGSPVVVAVERTRNASKIDIATAANIIKFFVLARTRLRKFRRAREAADQEYADLEARAFASAQCKTASRSETNRTRKQAQRLIGSDTASASSAELRNSDLPPAVQQPNATASASSTSAGDTCDASDVLATVRSIALRKPAAPVFAPPEQQNEALQKDDEVVAANTPSTNAGACPEEAAPLTAARSLVLRKQSFVAAAPAELDDDNVIGAAVAEASARREMSVEQIASSIADTTAATSNPNVVVSMFQMEHTSSAQSIHDEPSSPALMSSSVQQLLRDESANIVSRALSQTQSTTPDIKAVKEAFYETNTVAECSLHTLTDELQQEETRLRMDIQGRVSGKISILSGWWYQSAISILSEAERQGRSKVSLAEGAARRGLEELIVEALETETEHRYAVLKLQTWCRQILSKKRYIEMLRTYVAYATTRIESEVCDDKGTSINGSLVNVDGSPVNDQSSSELLNRAATAIQRVARGMQGRRAFKVRNSSVAWSIEQRIDSEIGEMSAIKKELPEIVTSTLLTAPEDEQRETRVDRASRIVTHFMRSVPPRRKLAALKAQRAALTTQLVLFEDFTEATVELLWNVKDEMLLRTALSITSDTVIRSIEARESRERATRLDLEAVEEKGAAPSPDVVVESSKKDEELTVPPELKTLSDEGTAPSENILCNKRSKTNSPIAFVEESSDVPMVASLHPSSSSDQIEATISRAAPGSQGDAYQVPRPPAQAQTAPRPQRPESARIPSHAVTKTPQPAAAKRPGTASLTGCAPTNYQNARKAGQRSGAPYVDSSHDTETVLRSLTTTPIRSTNRLFAAAVGGDDEEDVDDYIVDDEDDLVDVELTGSVAPSRPNSARRVTSAIRRQTSNQRSDVSQYVDYVGMLSILKSHLEGFFGGGELANPLSEMLEDTHTTRVTGISYHDLVDVLYADCGPYQQIAAARKDSSSTSSSKSVSPSPSFHNTPQSSNQSFGPTDENGVAGSADTSLADLWKDESFVVNVIRNLDILVPQQYIATHLFSLEEIALVVLSAIKVHLGSELRDLPVGCLGVANGKVVARQAAFEMFCSLLVTCFQRVSSERRAADSLAISNSFALLDIHRCRLIPRQLFDEVFSLRVPIPEGAFPHALPYVHFAAVLRRNLIHSPLTCQKHLGVFMSHKVFGRLAEGAKTQRARRIQYLESQIRSLSDSLLGAITSVGERAGVSLADALFLYSGLMSTAQCRQLEWLCLSFVCVWYNALQDKVSDSFTDFALLMNDIVELHSSTTSTGRTTLSLFLRTSSSTKPSSAPSTPLLSTAMRKSEVGRGVFKLWCSFIQHTAFQDLLRQQRTCDTAAFQTQYRTPLSETEGLDRCVPWSAMSTPVLDSLSFFASQRMTLDKSLTAKVVTDKAGYLVVPADDGTIPLFTPKSASTHIDGFEQRREQLNSIVYTLRHYSLCLAEIGELQCLHRGDPLQQPSTRNSAASNDSTAHRVTSAGEAEDQLLAQVCCQVLATKTAPIRAAVSDDVAARRKAMFTDRFTAMLFSLPVLETPMGPVENGASGAVLTPSKKARPATVSSPQRPASALTARPSSRDLCSPPSRVGVERRSSPTKSQDCGREAAELPYFRPSPPTQAGAPSNDMTSASIRVASMLMSSDLRPAANISSAKDEPESIPVPKSVMLGTILSTFHGLSGSGCRPGSSMKGGSQQHIPRRPGGPTMPATVYPVFRGGLQQPPLSLAVKVSPGSSEVDNREVVAAAAGIQKALRSSHQFLTHNTTQL